MRRRALGALLVLVWVLLWDRFTIGQLLAGAAVAAAVLALLRPSEGDTQVRIPFRPVALVRLGAWFGHQVILSNLQVARAALFPRKHVRPGVVRIPLSTRSPQLAALIANLTALSPGMQPVGTDDSPAIEVHVLTLDTDARAIISRLEELVFAAFGTEPEEAA